jgi:hypothetical protein
MTFNAKDGVGHLYRPMWIRLLKFSVAHPLLCAPLILGGLITVKLAPPEILERLLFTERNEGTRRVANDFGGAIHLGGV